MPNLRRSRVCRGIPMLYTALLGCSSLNCVVGGRRERPGERIHEEFDDFVTDLHSTYRQ